MDYGRLKQQVQFIKTVQLPDGAGGTIPGTAVIKTTLADVKPLKQNRTLQANQSQLQSAYEVIIRFRRDFTPDKTMRVKYQDKIMPISSIQQVEENRQCWLIICMDSQ